MGIVKLSIRKLLYRPWSGIMSILLFAIGTGIISLVGITERLVKDQFLKQLAGIDLVVGAKGSPVQLILSSLLHLDVPTGNISLAEANQLSNHPMVKEAIPVSLGDNYRGVRIVGTTPALGDLYGADMALGGWFDHPFEAVVGSVAAKRAGLMMGGQFTGRHGFTEHGHAHDDEIYTVTGILLPTGTILDQLILTPVETYWLLHQEHGDFEHDHDHEHEHEHVHDHTMSSTSGEDRTHLHGHHHEHDHHLHDSHTHPANEAPGSEHLSDRINLSHHEHGFYEIDEEEAEWLELIEKLDRREDLSPMEMHLYQQRTFDTAAKGDLSGREITALLLKYETPGAALQLPRFINENTRMQAASPAFEMNRMFALAGNGLKALLWLAYLIIAISMLNLLGHLAQTLSRNMHEIALVRTLGASKKAVMLLLLLQGIWISITGGVLGILLAKFLLLSLSNLAGNLFSITDLMVVSDLWILLGSPILGIVAAVMPALKAYRNDIHYILTRE